MRIDWLHVRNFRGFSSREFAFPRRIDAPAEGLGSFHVIIGDNGSGKSSVLDALSVAMGAWMLGLSRFSKACKTRPIDPAEVRLQAVAAVPGGASTLEACFPVEIEARGHAAGEALRWKRSLAGVNSRTSQGDAAAIKTAATALWNDALAGVPKDLPLLSYYGAGRHWQQPRDVPKHRVGLNGKSSKSRLEGYLNSHDPRASWKDLLRWIAKQELAALQEGAPSPEFEAVKSAILRCLDGGRRIEYNVKREEILVDIEGQGVQTFDNLSDGYRGIVAMAGDIALKSVLLNPHRGADAPRTTPGIVLIDEIDLHLHPNWQRRVVHDLQTAFPNLQFIATTHSPFVVQSLHDGELIPLTGQPVPGLGSKSIEDIARGVMDVAEPEVSRHYRKEVEGAKDYLALLDEAAAAPRERLAEYESRLAGTLAPFAGNPALQAFLEMKRVAKLGR